MMHRTFLLTGSSILLTTSLQVLQSLLSSIPSFWASEEIVSVADLYLSYGIKEATTLSSLVKNVTKRVQSSVLLPTLCELWKSSLVSGEKVSVGQPDFILEVDYRRFPKGHRSAKRIFHSIEKEPPCCSSF
jgi:hypothetical protein